ncbi:MAG: CcmD family protein [Chitinophagales bacterium]|jgi:CcmD family protein
MMNKTVSLTILSVFFSQLVWAQEELSYQALLNQSNKMIAVILVLVIILLGIGLFLFFMDKKISKLEKKINKK